MAQNNLLVFKKFRLEDISKDTNQSLQNFANIFNQFGQNVYNLLSGGLTIENNVRGMVYTNSFSTPANYSDGVNSNFSSFSFKVAFQPSGVMKMNLVPLNSGTQTPNIKPVDVSWVYNGTQVAITYVTGLQPNGKYTITLLII